MRTLHVLLLALVAAIALPACVSSGLARDNTIAVETLGRAAVVADPASATAAEKALATARKIEESTAFLDQVFSFFGLPDGLAAQMVADLEALLAQWDATKDVLSPEERAAGDAAAARARETTGAIAGRDDVGKGAGAVAGEATNLVPWGGGILGILAGAASIWWAGRKKATQPTPAAAPPTS